MAPLCMTSPQLWLLRSETTQFHTCHVTRGTGASGLPPGTAGAAREGSMAKPVLGEQGSLSQGGKHHWKSPENDQLQGPAAASCRAAPCPLTAFSQGRGEVSPAVPVILQCSYREQRIPQATCPIPCEVSGTHTCW